MSPKKANKGSKSVNKSKFSPKFIVTACQNAVAMTTSNGLSNGMSEMLQGLTPIVIFGKMSIL